jgi:hypothetical protein
LIGSSTPIQRSFEPSQRACLPCTRELAFPNPHGSPASSPQSSRYKTIARNILLKFRQPEFNPTFRRVAEFAVRMPMPETAVDEYGN